MQYRKFGNLGFEISTFGFGCMRLPIIGQGNQQIDEPRAIEMIRYAIDHGVNYVDTAYPYHGGNSETLVGKALKVGYRARVKLATKLPSWLINTTEDMEKYLDQQLAKLDTEYVDFYLLHALDKERWEKLKGLGALEFLDRMKKIGKIRHAGFSFHDELPVFKEIIDGGKWDMCQIQLNFLDENYQAGMEGLHYAAERGIPVVIMEPLKGGSLVNELPEDVQKVWNSAEIHRSPVEWAFRWVGNLPEVVTVLSGVGSLEQVKDNIAIFEQAKANSLSEKEIALIEEVKEIYHSRIKVGCTGCSYCMPCPSGVAIPDIFRMYNDSSVFGKVAENRRQYAGLVKENRDASQCVECGSCESACPQHIDVIEKLKNARAALSTK